jgi:hypothetical protein
MSQKLDRDTGMVMTKRSRKRRRRRRVVKMGK